MTKLTAKQEKFAQCIADGMTQADSYRAAYDVKNMKPETIHKRASELMVDGEVAGRVGALKIKLESKNLWTRAEAVSVLKKEIDQHIDNPSPASANVCINAVDRLNLMHGFNEPIKVDHSSSDGTMSTLDITRLSNDQLEALGRGILPLDSKYVQDECDD